MLTKFTAVAVILLSAIISCTNNSSISNQDALHIAGDYLSYKNSNYDGYGTAKPEKITITSVKEVKGTLYVKFTWSGKFKEEPRPNRPETDFATVTDIEDEAVAVKKEGKWFFGSELLSR